MRVPRIAATSLAFALLCGAVAAPALGPVAKAAPAVLDIEEHDIPAPGGEQMRVVTARPNAQVPRPVVLILHGTHGFAEEYVTLAREIAAAGYVAVAACWFAPGSGDGMRFVTPRACPANAPALVRGDSPDAQVRVTTLIDAVARLPGADPDRVVLLGHSRGAVAAMFSALNGSKARALILNSAAFPPAAMQRASAIDAPVLILHGERDSPEDGGSEMTAIARAREFASALRTANKQVETHFYPRGGHNSLFADLRQHRAEVVAIAQFLRRTVDRRPPAALPTAPPPAATGH